MLDFYQSMLFGLAAIAVVLVSLYLVLTLRAGVPGDGVGRKWRFLTLLVVLFTAGYLVTPYLDQLPPSEIRLIVSIIFFFGGIYVLIMVPLVYTVLRELAG